MIIPYIDKRVKIFVDNLSLAIKEDIVGMFANTVNNVEKPIYSIFIRNIWRGLLYISIGLYAKRTASVNIKLLTIITITATALYMILLIFNFYSEKATATTLTVLES